MADTDQRHIDREAELARQQAVKDAVANIDWASIGREAEAQPAPEVIERRRRFRKAAR